MGTGYVRADTANNIADGNVINAEDFDNEYDSIQAAFNAATGHNHDGTTGNGSPILTTGPVQDYVFNVARIEPKTDNTYDLGSPTKEFKDLYIDGVANIDSLIADTAAITGGTINNTIIGGTTPVAGTFTTMSTSGAAITGGTINNTIIGGTTPAAGTFTSVSTSSAAITGGTINNTIIGGITPAAGTFSSMSTASAAITGGTINNTIIGGTTPAAGTFSSMSTASAAITGGTISGVSASNNTITGGTINNTVIGGTTPAAGTFTTIAGTLSGATINGSSNTITNVSLTTAVTDVLPVANGGTGANTLTGVVIGNGTSAFTTKTNPTGAFVGTTDSQTLTNKIFTGLLETRVAMGANDIDLSAGNYFTKTISGTTTLTVSNVPTTGTAISFILDLTNGGSATVNWWANVKWVNGVAPTLTAAGRDSLGFYTYDNGTTWTGLLLGKDIK